jgi:eukaryotic-like serine/threonine-protein kinase
MTHAVGEMIAGRYEVVEVLKKGRQGEVYRVLDHNENAVGVLKLIDTNLLPGGVWDEAHALRQLADDHILPIRNADVTPTGQPYLVTALAEHGTLETAFDATNGLGLPVDDVVTWIRQACMGIARAHDASLVHNDIKPANLFLTVNRECLVGDFGLASLIPAPPLIGVARGATPETAAPEVASAWWMRAPPASFQTDVYSLGATAYWLLAGRPPVDLRGVRGVDARMSAAAAQTPPRLRNVAPHVPAAVANPIEEAIRPNPDDRYRTVSHLAAALGSRRTKARRWKRTNEHPAHLGCWRGERPGRSTYILCLEQGARSTTCVLTTKHESGPRVPSGSRTCSTKNWAQAVRATIDKLS